MADIIIKSSTAGNFTIISNDFARNPEVTPRAAKVFLYLMSNAEGWATSASRIAKVIGMGEGTVKSALRDLEGLGYLKRERKNIEGGRFEWSYEVYATPLPIGQKADDGATSENSTSPQVGAIGQKTTDGLTTDGKLTRIRRTIPKKNNDKKNKEHSPLPPTGAESALFEEPLSFADEHHPADPLDDQFNEFWKVYPHFNKVTKAMAKKSLGRALKKADFGTIMAGARNYALQCERERTEKKFVAHATTWLNQERWELSQDSLVNDSSPQNNDGLEVLRSMMGK